jgi:hypothetical protein
MSAMWSPRIHTKQTTEVNVPIDVVWEQLSDFRQWREWHPSLRLHNDDLILQEEAIWVQAKLACQGKGVGCATRKTRTWMNVNIAFQTVNRNEFTVSFTIKRGFSKNTTTMKLTALGSKKTLLTHTQDLRGSIVSFGSSHRTLLINSFCINQSFKNHVECLHFQSLFSDMSTREMTPKSYRLLEEQGSSDCLCASSASSTDFWQSSAALRKEVVSQFVEDVAQ